MTALLVLGGALLASAKPAVDGGNAAKVQYIKKTSCSPTQTSCTSTPRK